MTWYQLKYHWNADKKTRFLAALKQSYYNPPSDRRYESTQYYQEPKLPESTKFKAIVTEVDAKLNIYFRVMFDEGDKFVNVINQTITNALKEKSTLAPFVGSFERGRACTAYFNYDKTWNRAEIVGLVRSDIGKTSLLLVYFVDYGNSEQVFAEELSSEVFNLEIPKLALKAQLHNCKPYEPERVLALQKELNTLLIDKVCTFTRVNHQEPMKVSIEIPDIGDLHTHLVNSDLIVNATDSFESVPSEIRNITDLINHTNYEGNGLVFKRDVYYPVVITEMMPCGYIYLQANHIQDVADLEEEKINKQYFDFVNTIERMRLEVNHFPALFRFKRGDPCCVQFSSDELWYRAMILKVIEPEREAEVVYVDYGNTEIVDVNRIKSLPSKYVEAPPVNAFVCHLCNVIPTTKDGIWLKKHTERLRDVLLPIEYLVARFKTETEPYEVELFEAVETDQRNPTQNALKSLVDQGILRAMEDN